MIELEGVVVKCLDRELYEVGLENGHKVRAHAGGKIKEAVSRVLPGKKVCLCLTVRDLSQGRILRVLD